MASSQDSDMMGVSRMLLYCRDVSGWIDGMAWHVGW